MFFSTNKKRKVDDPNLKKYCDEKENCRRSILLSGVGCDDYVRIPNQCCDVCSLTCATCSDDTPCRIELNVTNSKEKRKRRSALRIISQPLHQTLKNNLIAEREKILDENPSFKMIGCSQICSNFVIDELCSKAKFWKAENDVDVFGIRPEYRKRFADVVLNTISDAPPTKYFRKQ